MQHGTQVKILRELLHQIDTQHNVDAGAQYAQAAQAYTDTGLAEREWQRLFRGHPQVVGLSHDLPEAGSYLTVDDFGVPVLVTRDAGGRARAFLNACRHRGARIATAQRGRAERFTCGFHAWTYAGDGELLRVPREADFGEVDKACHGLLELPCAERHGLLWVHPDPRQALDTEELLGALGAELEDMGLAQMRYHGNSNIVMDLNWKLANDTFGETYHFARLHRNTLNQMMHGDVLAYEEFGRNHRFVVATREIDALRERTEAQWNIFDGALVIYYLFPNIQLTLNRTGANLVRIYPDKANPGRSISRISHYLREEVMQALEAAGSARVTAASAYDMEARRGTVLIAPEVQQEIFHSTIEQEDYAMGAQIQRAAESGLLEELIFGRNEPALHHFHRCFSEVTDAPPPRSLGRWRAGGQAA